MKTNKRIPIILIASLLLAVQAIQAQITIGDNIEPSEFSILEIVSGGKGGLRLPQLDYVQRQKLEDSDAFQKMATDESRGLMIYNTDINCVEYWNTQKWVSLCKEACIELPVDVKATLSSCRSYMFTYQSMEITATYEGKVPDFYRWMADGKCVVGEGTSGATYIYTPSDDLELVEDELGNWKKTVTLSCQMEVDGKKVQTADYEILVVKATKGELSPIFVKGWNSAGTALEKKTFAHVNLGDENETNPCNMAGYLFQWGRSDDDHKIPDSNTTTTLATDNTPTLPAEVIDRFILTSASPYDWRSGGGNLARWGDGSQAANMAKATNDPCPPGWKVPSQAQWGDIFCRGTISGVPGMSTAGTWEWITGGYKVDSTLFLPVAGKRGHNDGLPSGTGTSGYYWSTTTNADYSYYLDFGTNINPGSSSYRSAGHSVRCIEETCVEITGVTVSGAAVAYLPGETITMSATVAPVGASKVTYQWYKDGVALSGKTAATLSIPNCTSSYGGRYTVKVSNSCSTVTSTATNVLVFLINRNVNSGTTTVNTTAAFFGGSGDAKTRGTGITYGNKSAGVFRYRAGGGSSALVTYTHGSGLIVRVNAATLANGEGQLLVYVSGTPKSGYAGRAFDIPVTVLGKTLYVRVSVGCGAYTSATRVISTSKDPAWLQFRCFNEGVTNTNLDPFVPAAGIHGGKYRWGVKSIVLTQAQDQANPGTNPIGKWSTTGSFRPATNADWNMTTANPCPSGWRVPTYAEMNALRQSTSNTLTRKGSWTNSPTNYSSGLLVGSALFLPSAGWRFYLEGELRSRGAGGNYWTTRTYGTGKEYTLWVQPSNIIMDNTNAPGTASSLRCVSN